MLLSTLLIAALLQAPPRSSDHPRPTNESSSKDTRIDLTAPAGDTAHPGSDVDEEAEAERTGVREAKPWNPHKAMKSIEVGDYYATQKNYAAAISRYKEALEWKPGDQEATIKLARISETAGHAEQAYLAYRDYLKAHPKGNQAGAAKEAVERLQARVDMRHSQPDPSRNIDVAETYLKMKNYSGATSRLQEALKAEPENARLHFLLGMSMEGEGKLNDALNHYYAYVSREPGGPHSSQAAAAIERLKLRGAVLTSQSSRTPR